MDIWRLENYKGVGPYSSGSNAFMLQKSLPFVECANVDCGCIGCMPINWVCGCPSKEILEWMFGPILKSLTIEGFFIKKYEVQEGDYILGKSGKQVIFKKPK